MFASPSCESDCSDPAMLDARAHEVAKSLRCGVGKAERGFNMGLKIPHENLQFHLRRCRENN